MGANRMTSADPDADSEPAITRRLDIRLEDFPEAWRFGFPLLGLGYIGAVTMWLSGEYTPEMWHLYLFAISFLLAVSAVETWYRTNYRDRATEEGE